MKIIMDINIPVFLYSCVLLTDSASQESNVIKCMMNLNHVLKLPVVLS